MTTSTRAVPLLVPDSDTGVRYPSDVFTGDGHETLTQPEWERRHEATYGERGLTEGSTPSSPAKGAA